MEIGWLKGTVGRGVGQVVVVVKGEEDAFYKSPSYDMSDITSTEYGRTTGGASPSPSKVSMYGVKLERNSAYKSFLPPSNGGATWAGIPFDKGTPQAQPDRPHLGHVTRLVKCHVSGEVSLPN